MVITSKISESKHAKLQNSIHLRVRIVGDLCSNSNGSECFFKSQSCNILVICEGKLK